MMKILHHRGWSTSHRRSDFGYALFFAMVLVAVLLISLTAALPDIYQEGQREREAELVFRGTQYARAIANYHRQFQRYPAKIEDLTKSTNGMRFLRQEYLDPMTPGGKWRFIHANGMGVLVDSKTMNPNQQGQGQPGVNQGSGASGQTGMGGSGFGQQGMGGGGFGQSGMGDSGFGQQGVGGGGFGQSGMGGSGFGQQGMGGGGFGQSGMGGSGLGQQGMGGGGFGQSGMGTSGFDQQSAGGGGFGPSSGSGFGQSSMGGSGFGQSSSGAVGGPNQSTSAFSSSPSGGLYIVGVASTSHKKSIRVLKQKTYYDEWEFLGTDVGALGIGGGGIPPASPGTGGQPGQPTQPGAFGQPGQPTQPGTFGQPSQGNSTGFGQTQGSSQF